MISCCSLTLCHMLLPQTERTSHSQILFLCISYLLQITYKGVGWTPGIIILISLILSYIQNSIKTKRHWFWIDKVRWAKCSAEDFSDIIEMRSLTCIIKYHSTAWVLTNNVGTVNECLYSVIENNVCSHRTSETQLKEWVARLICKF